MVNKARRQPDQTYYDAGEADEGQYKRHISFCGRDTTAWFECVYRLTATQNPGEEQAL
jgi:hypothetical protein